MKRHQTQKWMSISVATEKQFGPLSHILGNHNDRQLDLEQTSEIPRESLAEWRVYPRAPILEGKDKGKSRLEEGNDRPEKSTSGDQQTRRKSGTESVTFLDHIPIPKAGAVPNSGGCAAPEFEQKLAEWLATVSCQASPLEEEANGRLAPEEHREPSIHPNAIDQMQEYRSVSEVGSPEEVPIQASDVRQQVVHHSGSGSVNTRGGACASPPSTILDMGDASVAIVHEGADTTLPICQASIEDINTIRCWFNPPINCIRVSWSTAPSGTWAVRNGHSLSRNPLISYVDLDESIWKLADRVDFRHYDPENEQHALGWITPVLASEWRFHGPAALGIQSLGFHYL